MGSFSLLQGIFPTEGSNPGLLHCRRILYQLSHQGSPGIYPEKTLSPKDTRVNIESPCSDVQERRETSGQVFTTWGNTLLWSYTHYSAELEQILRQKGFPGGSAGKESACNAGGLGLIPRLGRSPGEAILEWVATPVFWPEEFHGLYHSRGRVHPWDATE